MRAEHVEVGKQYYAICKYRKVIVTVKSVRPETLIAPLTKKGKRTRIVYDVLNHTTQKMEVFKTAVRFTGVVTAD